MSPKAPHPEARAGWFGYAGGVEADTGSRSDTPGTCGMDHQPWRGCRGWGSSHRLRGAATSPPPTPGRRSRANPGLPAATPLALGRNRYRHRVAVSFDPDSDSDPDTEGILRSPSVRLEAGTGSRRDAETLRKDASFPALPATLRETTGIRLSALPGSGWRRCARRGSMGSDLSM